MVTFFIMLMRLIYDLFFKLSNLNFHDVKHGICLSLLQLKSLRIPSLLHMSELPGQKLDATREEAKIKTKHKHTTLKHKTTLEGFLTLGFQLNLQI